MFMRVVEAKKISIRTGALLTTLCARRARVHIKGKGKGAYQVTHQSVKQ